LGTPGIRGLSVEFDVSEAGGKASVAMQDGAIQQPGLLVDSDIAVQQLSADVQWKQAMAANAVFSPVLLSASTSNLRFANADIQGEAQFTWNRTAPSDRSTGAKFAALQAWRWQREITGNAAPQRGAGSWRVGLTRYFKPR